MVQSSVVSDDRPTSATASSQGLAVADGRGALASLPKQVETVRLAPGVERMLSQCSIYVGNTVLSARAPSMRRTYASRWNLFVSWCEKQAINPVDCPVSGILDFLQHLLDAGRSPATLRVFASPLSALWDPMGQGSVGADRLVVAYLKGARAVPSGTYEWC